MFDFTNPKTNLGLTPYSIYQICSKKFLPSLCHHFVFLSLSVFHAVLFELAQRSYQISFIKKIQIKKTKQRTPLKSEGGWARMSILINSTIILLKPFPKRQRVPSCLSLLKAQALHVELSRLGSKA